MAKRILCVIRTSTIRQEIISQHNDMIPYLQSKGYSEDEIEWLEAQGASARCANKAYLDMLDSIKTIISASETIKACAVWHLNRLGRIGRYIDEMKNWFIDNHIQLLVKNPDITLLNPDGSYNVGNNIIFTVFSATIPTDTQEMMEKMQRGKRRKIEEGKFVGGGIKFGFTIDANKYIVVNPEEMAIVKSMFEEYATGKYSWRTLSLEFKSRGTDISDTHLCRMLKNEIYKPYVGEELFNKIREVSSQKDWKVSTKESKYTHLSLRVLKCKCCGANYISDTDHYICYRKKAGKRFENPCTESATVPTEVLDTILWDLASYIHRGYLLKVDSENVEEFKKRKNILNLKQQQLNTDLQTTNEALDRAKLLFVDGDLSKAQYDAKKVSINAKITQIERTIEINAKELEQIEDSLYNLQHPDITTQVALMASVGDIDKADEMRSIIQKHIKYATVDRGEFEGRKCITIHVLDRYDEMHTFLYDYLKGRGKEEWIRKLYRLTKDGYTRYSWSGQSINQILTEKLNGSVEILKDADAIQKQLVNMLPTLKLAMSEGLETGLTEDDIKRIERMKQEEVTPKILEQLHFTTSVVQFINNKDKE